MHVYIVIPVHNRKLLTQKCLESLYAQSFRAFSIIVVDDGSTDGTSTMVAQHFPETILLSGDGNLWWIGAINKGIRHALSLCDMDDYILVINDDLTVLVNYLAGLVSAAQHHPRALIGSVETTYSSPHRIKNGGVLVNWVTAKKCVLNQGHLLDSFAPNHVVKVNYLTGRGTLFPSSVFRECGLYDEVHFRQCGDTELPIRASLKYGIGLFVAYDAVVISYDEMRNGINEKDRFSFGDAGEYFFGLRSHSNLKDRFWFAYGVAPNPLWFLRYFLMDAIRIIGHFLLRFRFRHA